MLKLESACACKPEDALDLPSSAANYVIARWPCFGDCISPHARSYWYLNANPNILLTPTANQYT